MYSFISVILSRLLHVSVYICFFMIGKASTLMRETAHEAIANSFDKLCGFSEKIEKFLRILRLTRIGGFPFYVVRAKRLQISYNSGIIELQKKGMI